MTEEELLEAGLNGVRASLPALGRYGYEARVPRIRASGGPTGVRSRHR